jgi:hypothetical protein
VTRGWSVTNTARGWAGRVKRSRRWADPLALIRGTIKPIYVVCPPPPRSITKRVDSNGYSCVTRRRAGPYRIALPGLEILLLTVTAARTAPDGNRRVLQVSVNGGGGALEPHPPTVNRRAHRGRSAAGNRFTHSAYSTDNLKRHTSCRRDISWQLPPRRLLHRTGTRAAAGCFQPFSRSSSSPSWPAPSLPRIPTCLVRTQRVRPRSGRPPGS